MNILGVEYYDRRHATFLRLNFPIKYGIIDFGMSRRFETDKVPHLADIYTGRPTKAPEINQKIPYDPFAADVYQTGAMLLSLCWVCFFWQAILHHLIPNVL
jgi:serine/threonine protein kinase